MSGIPPARARPFRVPAIAAPQIPESFPPYLVANTTWQWRQRLFDQATGDEFAPDDLGTVTIYFDGHYSIEFTATGDTTLDDWLFSLAPTASPGTDDITTGTGKYRWRILGVLSGKTYNLGSGEIWIYENPDSTAGQDRRTHAQKMVALLQAEMEARVTGLGTGHSSYTIASRSIDKLDIEALRRLLNQYRQEANGRPKPFLVTFGGSR